MCSQQMVVIAEGQRSVRRYRYVLTGPIMATWVAVVLSLAGFLYLAPSVSAAPCTVPSTDYGTATMTVNIPQTGNYRIWSRMATANATDNSYLLEVDGNTCFTVGDGSFNVGSWNANSSNWVDYQNGNTNSKINMNLTAGNHTIRMIGNAADVRLDRVIFTSDTSCVPVGVGENCANPPDIYPPTVSITSPANNSTHSGTITVSANAVDDVGGSGIDRVEFYVNGTLRGTDSSSPYQHSLDTTTLTPGSHNLMARAYDVAGNMTSSSVIAINVTAPPDTTQPTVSITSPANNSTHSGTITVSANASDNVGVTRVEFFINGQLISTDMSSPYTASLNTNNYTNGQYALTARAYDAANNNRTSSTVNITINNTTTPPPDTTPPTVSLTSPTAGSTISGTHTMTATAGDNVGVTRVEFYIDGTLRNTDTSAPFSYNVNTTTLSNGNHTFRARAYDAANNSTWSTTITATVNNVTYIDEDINQDGRVNILDFSLLVARFGQTGGSLGRADINGDGRVNILDFSLLANRFGYGT